MTIALDRPLSLALREETARAHEAAEGSSFMQRLMAGELDAKAVADLTGQLWFVYETLERTVRAVAETATAGAVADPRLERRDALEVDLTQQLGGDWRDKVRILPATAAYVARL